MQRIGLKTEAGETQYHDSRNLNTDEAWESGSGRTYVVTNQGKGEAVDCDGCVNKGFFYTLREATPEELAQRETERAEWEAKTSEERTAIRLQDLTEALPSLDW